MIVDSSVLLQILFDERGAENAVRTLSEAPSVRIAAPTLLEAEIVFGSAAGFGTGAVRELAERLAIDVQPFTLEHTREAILAYAQYGKGRGHPARLNFGDCIAYAFAKVAGEALAFKGDDFDKTALPVVKLG